MYEGNGDQGVARCSGEDARVEIVEVGPRDGLQNEAVSLTVEEKLGLVRRMIGYGAKRVEAVSFVNPERVPQMAGAEEVMAAVPRLSGVSYAGLVLNHRGLERAIAAGVDEVNFVVVATDSFSLRNQGTTTAESVQMWADIAGRSQRAGIRSTVTIAAAFGCPFEGEVGEKHVLELVRCVCSAYPSEIALADTIGVAVPTQVSELVSGVREVAPGIPTRCHLHNTRNTGYANAVAALEAGVSALDASVGGIGGCPFAPSATGNIATEDLTYVLERMGVNTGISLAGAVAAAEWVGGLLGKEVPALLGRAGVFPPTAAARPCVGARRGGGWTT